MWACKLLDISLLDIIMGVYLNSKIIWIDKIVHSPIYAFIVTCVQYQG